MRFEAALLILTYTALTAGAADTLPLKCKEQSQNPVGCRVKPTDVPNYVSITELKHGSQVSRSLCSAERSECNTDALQGQAATCGMVTKGSGDKVITVYGLRTAGVPFVFCGGSYGKGWGSGGCTC